MWMQKSTLIIGWSDGLFKCETTNHRTLLILVIVHFISTKNLSPISSMLSRINIADFTWYNEIYVYMCAIARICMWEQIQNIWGDRIQLCRPYYICQTALSQMSPFFSYHLHRLNPTLSEDAHTRTRINIWWYVDSLAIDQSHP